MPKELPASFPVPSSEGGVDVCPVCHRKQGHKKDCPRRTGQFEVQLAQMDATLAKAERSRALEIESAKRILVTLREERARLLEQERILLGEESGSSEEAPDRTAYWIEMRRKIVAQLRQLEEQQKRTSATTTRYAEASLQRERLVDFQTHLQQLMEKGTIEPEDEVVLLESIEGLPEIQALLGIHERLLNVRRRLTAVDDLIARISPDIEEYERLSVDVDSLQEEQRAAETVTPEQIKAQELSPDVELASELFAVMREAQDRRLEREGTINELTKLMEELDKVGSKILQVEDLPDTAPQHKAFKREERRELRLARDRILARVDELMTEAQAEPLLDLRTKRDALKAMEEAVTFTQEEERELTVLQLEEYLRFEGRPREIMGLGESLTEEEAKRLVYAYVIGSAKEETGHITNSIVWHFFKPFENRAWYQQALVLSDQWRFLHGKSRYRKMDEHGFSDAYAWDAAERHPGFAVAVYTYWLGGNKDTPIDGKGSERKKLPDPYYRLLKEDVVSQEQLVKLFAFGVDEFGRRELLVGEQDLLKHRLDRFVMDLYKQKDSQNVLRRWLSKEFDLTPVWRVMNDCLEDQCAANRYENAVVLLEMWRGGRQKKADIVAELTIPEWVRKTPVEWEKWQTAAEIVHRAGPFLQKGGEWFDQEEGEEITWNEAVVGFLEDEVKSGIEPLCLALCEKMLQGERGVYGGVSEVERYLRLAAIVTGTGGDPKRFMEPARERVAQYLVGEERKARFNTSYYDRILARALVFWQHLVGGNANEIRRFAEELLATTRRSGEGDPRTDLACASLAWRFKIGSASLWIEHALEDAERAFYDLKQRHETYFFGNYKEQLVKSVSLFKEIANYQIERLHQSPEVTLSLLERLKHQMTEDQELRGYKANAEVIAELERVHREIDGAWQWKQRQSLAA